MKVKVLLLYGTLLCLLWSTENVRSVILTSTLITGFMGGYLIGRMNLGTFVNLLANNGTLLPSLTSLFPREEQQKAAVNSYPVVQAALPFYVPTTMTTLIGYHGANGPYYMYGNGAAGMVPTHHYQPMMQMQVASVPATVPPSRNADLTIHPMTPVEVPISLDNKIRERFINQLALIDPLNCLPKIFCEVSADPYGTAVAIDHGTIAAVQPSSSNHASISLEKLEAYELYLQKQTTTTTPATPTTESTSESTVNEDVQNDKGDSDEEDDESGSDENDSEEDDIDDSFEQYRKEEAHKLEMQALEEMAEDIEDPMYYPYILKDKKKRKEQRKKYMEKQKKHEYVEMEEEPSSSFRLPEEELSFLRDDGHGQGQMFHYGEPDPPQYINRRFSQEPPGPPMPPPLPPRPPLFMPTMMQATESPITDMFSDDPFFDGFSTSSSRRMRQFSGMFRLRGKRQAKDDLMQNYRVAYKVAEKYRSPDMCKTVFPTCPYQTKTILRVVNRMESGLLPFNFGTGDKSNGLKDKNKNIDQFKNTLVAIERLNKAALAAHARGEPLNLQKIMEAASSPSIKIEANTSKNIIREFQEVVSKIKTAKLKKAKKKKKKNKERNNYDAVHYYKKAQMEALKPKERITPNPLKIYDVKKAVQDDEVQITRRKWEQVPSFKQTYHDMFKIAKTTMKPTTLPPFTTTLRPKQNPGASGSSMSTIRPIKKFSEGAEDDETEAKESEDRIYAMISQAKPDRSPIV